MARSFVAEVAGGVALLPRGLAAVARRPRLFVLAALPPLITSLLLVALLVLLLTTGDRLVAAATGFADDWPATLASLLRFLAALALVGGTLLLAVVTFTALTLTLGGPLYDRVSEAVDRALPEAPEAPDEPLLRSARRSAGQSAALVGTSAGTAVALFAVGLVPVVGPLVVPVASALVGGWLLALELVGAPLERRGVLTLAGRRALLRRRRWRVLGLCVPTFLLLAVPFVAVVVFPAATAAGVLLARQLLDEPTRG